MAWRALPLWAVRVCNTPEEAATVKAIYQREGCRVRTSEETARALHTWIRFWVVVARRPNARRDHAAE
jgi:hypothetical protein